MTSRRRNGITYRRRKPAIVPGSKQSGGSVLVEPSVVEATTTPSLDSESVATLTEPSTSTTSLSASSSVSRRSSRKRAHSLPSSEDHGDLVQLEPQPKKMLRSSACAESESSFVIYEEEEEDVFSDADENYQPWNMPSSSKSVENPLFRQLAYELEETKLGGVPVPTQLTAGCTHGLGTPEKVWDLMVRTDEVVRPTSRVLENHPNIDRTMRSVLIDWMMEVCETERQHRETFHLAVDYVDRFLGAFEDLPVEQFQLVGTSAVFVASKYEEIYPPKLEDFVTYTDGACSDEGVRAMEMVMLKALQWTLSPVTSLHWLGAFMQLLGKKEISPSASADDQHITPDLPCVVPDFMRDDYVHMAKILDLCLMDVGTLQFSYREIAAAVMFCCLEPQALIAQVTGYPQEALIRAIDWIDPFVRYCDKRRPIGDPMPHMDGVKADDMHNIQTHGLYESAEDALNEIANDRKEMQHRQREMRMAGRRAVLRARLRT